MRPSHLVSPVGSHRDLRG